MTPTPADPTKNDNYLDALPLSAGAKAWLDGQDVRALCLQQIAHYTTDSND